MPDLSARRPLTSRSSRWAGALCRLLLRMGVKPNQVSVFSVVFAAMAACGLLFLHGWPMWLVAALGIQLRLVCNLMDGMLAVEGGLRTPHGDLFNEFPDRLADTLILAALGVAGGTPLSQTLGWCAACGSLMTACVRMHGASLTKTHDFSGPMAKPHRMALATVLCLVMAVGHSQPWATHVIPMGLGLMVLGIVVTLIRRLRAVSHKLHAAAGENENV